MAEPPIFTELEFVEDCNHIESIIYNEEGKVVLEPFDHVNPPDMNSEFTEDCDHTEPPSMDLEFTEDCES